jgi:hypothetical protein
MTAANGAFSWILDPKCQETAHHTKFNYPTVLQLCNATGPICLQHF